MMQEPPPAEPANKPAEATANNKTLLNPTAAEWQPVASAAPRRQRHLVFVLYYFFYGKF